MLPGGVRPPRLDRGDSSSSSGGHVEPPKRSRGSRGKGTYQSVMELNQADFRAWRSAFNYDEPQNTEIDNCFWSPQMEKLHKDLYSQLSDLKKVCPHRVIDFDALAKKAAYFGGAVQVVDILGLRHLMTSHCNYNVPLIHQFYSTVVFDSSPNRGMTWMSGPHKLTSDFHEFADLLGYPFEGDTIPQGERMHIAGVNYDKNEMADLYAAGGHIGTSVGLLPQYDILLRLFRHTIAPSAGNNDDIRGGLVNLMIFAHSVFMDYG